MKYAIIYLSVIFGLLILNGCSDEGQVEYTADITGNQVTITASPGQLSHGKTKALIKKAVKEIEVRLNLLDQPDNPFNVINEAKEPVVVEGEMELLFSTLYRWQTETAGLWSPVLTDENRTNELSSSAGLGDSTSVTWRAEKPKLNQLPDGRFRIIGEGVIDPELYSFGWAVDAVAAVMIEGGITTAMIQLNDVYRSWGEPNRGEEWTITLPAITDEGTGYYILPPPGGLNLIDFSAEMYPGSSDYVNLLVWAEDALTACIISDIALTLGSHEAINWATDRDDSGLLYRFPDGGDTALEMDRTFSNTVEILLP